MPNKNVAFSMALCNYALKVKRKLRDRQPKERHSSEMAC